MVGLLLQLIAVEPPDPKDLGDYLGDILFYKILSLTATTATWLFLIIWSLLGLAGISFLLLTLLIALSFAMCNIDLLLILGSSGMLIVLLWSK